MSFGSSFSICQKNISVNPNVKLKCELKQSKVMYTALQASHTCAKVIGGEEWMYVQFELNSPTHLFPLQDKAAAEVSTLFVINTGRVKLNVTMYVLMVIHKKNRKNLRLHFIEFVAFETVNSSEDVNFFSVAVCACTLLNPWIVVAWLSFPLAKGLPCVCE